MAYAGRMDAPIAAHTTPDPALALLLLLGVCLAVYLWPKAPERVREALPAAGGLLVIVGIVVFVIGLLRLAA